MRALRSSLVGAAAIAFLAAGAGAQTIDYGALEQLFGEPVTTSATGKPQRASEVPATMEIISAEEIKRTGAANIPDVLQRVVGLDVMRTGFDTTDVSVRGYNQPYSPRLLVLVNGRQVYLDFYGMTAWSAIPVEMAEIRQIEVVKGPNTALFGFNAVGGVVNIVTYNPLYDDVNNVTARVGTNNYKDLSAVGTVKIGEKTGLRLSAGGYNADEFDTAVNKAEEKVRTDPQRRSIAANLLSEVAPGHQLGVELTKSSLDRFDVPPLYTYGKTNFDTWSAKLYYSANTDIGLVEASLYRNAAYIDSRLGSVLDFVDFSNVVTVAKLQDLFKIGTDHSFRISAEYRHNEMDSSPEHGGTVSYDVYSAGGMWDWQVNDAVSIVSALRLDHLRLGRSGTMANSSPFTNDGYDTSFTELSYNGGIVYKLTDVDTLRLMGSRGIQVPNMTTYAFMNPAGPVGVFGNPNIEPSIVTNYELGYDRALPSIGGSFKTSLYYQTNKQMLYTTDVVLGNSGPAVIFTNIGESKAVGTEFSLRGRISDDLSWKVGYAYENVQDDFRATTYNFEDSSPHHKVTAELDWRHGKWAANLFGLYSSETKGLRLQESGATTLVKVPSYFLMSGRVGYDITDKITVSVTGQNITQDTARLTPYAAEERRVFLTLSASF